MGLSYQSMGRNIWRENFLSPQDKKDENYVIALAGNPNTGKSTVFNALTGLNQHTGNWPGKTVLQAQGTYEHNQKKYLLVDLPGTYSLFANSPEEQVARDFICFGRPDVTAVVVDATCLERNLNLVLQVLEITGRVVVCVNLLDEAKRKGTRINLDKLSKELGVPVIGTTARKRIGLDKLKQAVEKIAEGKVPVKPAVIHYEPDIEEKVKNIISGLSPEICTSFNPRWLALRILEGDQTIFEALGQKINYTIPLDNEEEVRR